MCVCVCVCVCIGVFVCVNNMCVSKKSENNLLSYFAVDKSRSMTFNMSVDLSYL